jgi:hypothetical protein
MMSAAANVHRIFGLAVALAGVLLAAFLAAAPANAYPYTPTDVEYLTYLDEQRVMYTSEDDMIMLGREVVRFVATNPTTDRVVQAGVIINEAGFTTGEAAAVVVGAIGAYAPQYWTLIPGQADPGGERTLAGDTMLMHAA